MKPFCIRTILFICLELFLFSVLNPAAAGAPILDNSEASVLTSVAQDASDPAGDKVADIISGKVTDGNVIDNFEDNDLNNIWGGLLYGLNDAPDGLSTINMYTQGTDTYNSSDYALKAVATIDSGTLAYQGFAGVACSMYPDCTTTADLSYGTAFRYAYKGPAHTFKVELSDVNHWEYSVQASETWTTVNPVWSDFVIAGWADPTNTLDQESVRTLSWVIQEPTGFKDSLYIDAIAMDGFDQRGIAVTGAENGNGEWQYSTDNGSNWNNISSVGASTALVLDTNAYVRFVPNTGYTGNATITYSAWNQTDGSASGTSGVNAANTGGHTAFSSASGTARVDVTGSAKYTVSISVNPSGAGTTTPASSIMLETDETGSISATPGTWYNFSNWSSTGNITFGDANSASTTVTLTGSSDDAIAANFSCKPLQITAQPLSDTIIPVSGSVDLAVSADYCPSRTLSYQWRLNGSDIIGETSSTLSISSASKADSGSYTCVVSDGVDPLTSNTSIVNVYALPSVSVDVTERYVPVNSDAQFNVTVSGDGTMNYQWYNESGALTDETGTSLTLAGVDNSYDSSSYYFVATNEVGSVTSDTMTLYISSIYNPFTLKVARVDPYNNVDIQTNLYTDQDISSLYQESLSPYADSVMIFYRVGQYPVDAYDPEAQRISIPIKEIHENTANDSLVDTITVAALDPAVDFTYYFSYTVLWHLPSKSPPDSLMPITNDGSVFLLDTLGPANPVSISGSYSAGDSAVLTFTGISSLDTQADSLDVIGSFDPGFGSSFWTAGYSVDELSENMTVVIHHSEFSGETKDVYLRWKIQSDNGNVSSYKSSSFSVGKPRPVYSGTLTGTALSATQVELSWSAVDADGIKIWYIADDTIPLGHNIDSDISSVTPASVEVSHIVTNLSGGKEYCFGLQIVRDGIWSDITEDSRTFVTTNEYTGEIIVPNTFVIDTIWFSGEFDKNSIEIDCYLDTAIIPENASLKWGVTYGLNRSLVMSEQPSNWFPVDSDTFHVSRPVGQSIVFDTTYYAGLWLQGIDSAGEAGPPTGPGDSIVDSTYVGDFTWQDISYFKEGDSVSYANNNIFVLKNYNDGIKAEYTNRLIRFVPDENLMNGFVKVNDGEGFYFYNEIQTAPFLVGIRYGQLPAGISPSQIRLYRYDSGRGVLEVDHNAFVQDGVVWTLTSKNLEYPFVALVDTVNPSVVFESDTSSVVESDSDLPLNFSVSDNAANVIVHLYYGPGDQDYRYDSDIDTLSLMNKDINWMIRSRALNVSYGMRGIIVVSDGINIDTLNISRQVKTSSVDDYLMESKEWTPIVAPAILDNNSPETIFSTLKKPDAAEWSYDKKVGRIFQWWHYTDGDYSGWMEYNEENSDNFRLVSPKVIWVKTSSNPSIKLGSGITPSLKDPVTVTIPGNEFIDFANPLMFNVYLSDIVSETGNGADSLLYFYHWESSKSTYEAVDFYLPDLGPPDVRDFSGKMISSVRKENAYCVYNRSAEDIILKIPPVCTELSPTGGGMTKSEAESSVEWGVSFLWRKAGEDKEHCVWLGSSRHGGESVNLPLPPSFRKYGAGIYDSLNKKLFGKVLLKETENNNGVNKDILVYNNDNSGCEIEYKISTEKIPEDYSTVIMDGSDSSDKTDLWKKISLKPGEEKIIKLAAGNGDFLNNIKPVLNYQLALNGIQPNPVINTALINYTVSGEDIVSVIFKLYDMRGKALYSKRINKGSYRVGRNRCSWDINRGAANISAGVYLITMQVLKSDGKSLSTGKKKVTFIQ